VGNYTQGVAHFKTLASGRTINIMMRRVTGTVARTGRAVCARSWVRLAAPAAWLSAGGAKEWTSVTNSATKFDPRQFMQSEGPHDDGDVASLRRALLYRSRQTGWLETDLIMGRWAAENLDKLSIDELKEYAKIVKVIHIHALAHAKEPQTDTTTRTQPQRFRFRKRLTKIVK